MSNEKSDRREQQEVQAVQNLGTIFAEATEDIKKGYGVTIFVEDGVVKVRVSTKED